MADKIIRCSPTDLGKAVKRETPYRRGSPGILTFKRGARWGHLGFTIQRQKTSFGATPFSRRTGLGTETGNTDKAHRKCGAGGYRVGDLSCDR